MNRARITSGPVRQAGTWRSRAGAALRLIAALAAMAAPPLLLAKTVGNPLPAWPIDWTRVAESVQIGLIPSSVWVNVLAVTAWAVWAALVGLLAIEVAAVARNRPSQVAVPGWIRQVAATLVAATITLAQPAQLALAITGGDARPVAVAAAPASYTEVGVSLQPQPVAGERLVAVTEGDSWGGFATTVLGDASRGPELRTANLGRQVGDGDTISEATAFVEPGWLLLIPPDLDSGPSATTRARAQPDVTVGDDADASIWEVAPGDHFWGIATDTITDAWGRAPTDAETAPYWQQVIDANRDTLLPPGDPNVIYPGQQFVLPSAPPDPSTPIAEEAAPEPAAPADGDPPQDAVSDPPATSSSGPAADQPPSVTDSWIATIEEPAAGPEPAATHSEGPNAREDAPEVDQLVPADLEVEDRTPLGVPVGLAAGVAASSILAAGVLAMLRWRRRTLLQQRAPGMRLPTPLPEIYNEIAKLDAAAAPEETLDDLAALFASIPLDVHPVLVRLTDEGVVTLLFDDRGGVVPDPPTPWTLADDGMQGPVGWQARLGDRGPERSFGIPLLVTLGRSGTSTVLANVGAMGTLAVEGSPSEVRRRLRAISLDLATSRISYPVEVAIIDDEHLASLDRVRHIDDPTDEIEVALGELAKVVIDDRIPRLIVCHHDTRPPELPEELIGMVGVLAAEALTADTWVLDLEDDDTGHLRLPDGGTVRLDLPDIDPELLDHELSRLDQASTHEPDEPPDETTSDDVDPSGNGQLSHAPAPSTAPAWCEVRLLGPVEVVCDGDRVEGLTPGTLEILAYLATHPDGVTKERLDNVIWAGSAARPGSQRVTSALTKLRKVLGDGPDGDPLVPRRSGDEPIRLSEHLGTDLDRALAHLAVARDLPAELRTRELAAALELVRGEPLEGRAYSWATDISQRAIVQLQDAALEVARTCREAGDLDAADRAIEQGLKVLDPNGWLYLERAELERLRGRPEQPPRIFEIYRRKLADDADEIAGTVATPPPEIELAFRELMIRA